MSREGRNPKHAHIKCPDAPDISLTVHTHYDPTYPYYREHIDITRACIASMVSGAAGYKTELIIWDNGSPPEFRAMLREFSPDWLIEAPNIGPHNARRSLAAIARGKYINLSDDDILYRPGWLREMMAVMTTYPNAAVVSGSPMNCEFVRDFTPDHEFAKRTPGVKKQTGQQLIPLEWERDFCASVGLDFAKYKPSWNQTWLEYQGVKAWAMGHHMQMLCPRSVIAPFLLPTKELIEFWDIAKRISQAGHLQLTTFDRTAVHIGNRIDQTIRDIARDWKIENLLK